MDGRTRDGTAYSIEGEAGPAIVLVHGQGLTRAMWRWQVPALGINQARIASIREVNELGAEEEWGGERGMDAGEPSPA